ncbi:trehalose-6-phosphate synthase [Candidatus Uhrbacteria bacterium]|nr:trehalose-6-phosphate synthase [Candidatus Uhrbacteria bacterium]
MKQFLAALSVIVLIAAGVSIALAISQAQQEEKRLKSDLEYRSILLAESFKEAIEPNINKSEKALQKIVEKFANRERLAGLVIYDNQDSILLLSPNLTKESLAEQQFAPFAMDEDTARGGFATIDGKKMYLIASPMHEDQSVIGAVMVVQNADYIAARLDEIWKRNLLRLGVQIFLIVAAVVVILRWLIFVPIKSIARSLQSPSETNDGKGGAASWFFSPITKEITKMRRNLMEARHAAQEEARSSLERLASPWTAERLKEFVTENAKDRTIVLISNREPYIHTKKGNEITYHVPASGMVTAVEPIMQACGGTWIAYGSGEADREVVDAENKILVPPNDPKYVLQRIWLTEEENKGFYRGFSNEGLWPLFHHAHTRPIFRKEDWIEYKKVNGKFAQTVLNAIQKKEKPIVLVQDFHLALLPSMVKKSRPDAQIGIFWHIPWVGPESFSICPWKKEMLEGMLGADLLGFHTQQHCNNFIETVGRELESLIDYEQFTITRHDHTSLIRTFPISIAFFNGNEAEADYTQSRKRLLNKLDIDATFIGIGVDRLDYTKGILERLKAIEIFLTKYPAYQEKFSFIQVASPSRETVQKYREFAEDVRSEVERINARFQKGTWRPVTLLERHHTHEEIYELYRVANVCLVTSLHDGMNLVAKEYVASRNDEQGVLILSQFTGASRDLKDALIVNPYNGEQTADAIHAALCMPQSEQHKRMKKLRAVVRGYNVYRWSAEFLKILLSLG